MDIVFYYVGIRTPHTSDVGHMDRLVSEDDTFLYEMHDSTLMAIEFSNMEYLKLREADNGTYRELIGGLLVSGEEIVHTYRSVRDGVIFTNKRLIAIDIQGITGKKKQILTLPFDRVQAFSVETAGVIDIDSELYLWFSGMGQVKFEFTSRTDVSRICRHISECILD